MSSHTYSTGDDAAREWFDGSFRRALLWAGAYAVLSAVVALEVAKAMVTATSAVLPETPTRQVTTGLVVLAAGISCNGVLTSVARAAQRR